MALYHYYMVLANFSRLLISSDSSCHNLQMVGLWILIMVFCPREVIMTVLKFIIPQFANRGIMDFRTVIITP